MFKFPVYPTREVSLAGQVMMVVASPAMCMGTVVEIQDPRGRNVYTVMPLLNGWIEAQL
jgi:hypothetical protein